MDVYTALQDNPTYRTVELGPELLDIVTKQEEPLYFKAPASDGFAVLCSKHQTFKLKKKNHSNTVILARHGFDTGNEDRAITEEDLKKKKVIGITSFDSDFECRLDKGTIDTASLPVYNGEINLQVRDYHLKTSMQNLKEDSPISDGEFAALFGDLKGSEVEGTACILSDRFVSEALTMVITAVQATSDEFKALSPLEISQQINDPKFSREVVTTVLRKFSSNTPDLLLPNFDLDERKVAIWYGIESLKQHAKKLIAPNEFLIKWKKSFPQLYNVPIELKWLTGYFARPLSNRIQYFPKHFLSSDPKERFRELFAVQSSWDMEEIAPFVEELNVKHMKMDKFVIKYARRKIEGKKVVVTSR